MTEESRKDAVVVYIEGNPVTGNPLVGEPEEALKGVTRFVLDYKKNLAPHICSVVITHSYEMAWNFIDICSERLVVIITDSALFNSKMTALNIAPTVWIGGLSADYSLAILQLKALNKRDEEQRIERETTKIT